MFHVKHPPRPRRRGGCFRCRLPLAERFAALLADEASVRGLIGPREAPRLWERHLLNCAVLTDLMPEGSRCATSAPAPGCPGSCSRSAARTCV